MNVCSAFAKSGPRQGPNMLFNSVNPLDANAAAKAFYTFKDSQRSSALSLVEYLRRSRSELVWSKNFPACSACFAHASLGWTSLFADCRCIGSAHWESPRLDVAVRRGSSVV